MYMGIVQKKNMVNYPKVNLADMKKNMINYPKVNLADMLHSD
jgi:hypothetical protein